MSKIQNTTQIVTHSFSKGMNKDADPSFVGEGMWTHARNVVNNTEEGNLGSLSNEQSNLLCATAGLTMPPQVVKKYIIGAVLLFSDKWIVFTAGHGVKGNPITSEIGLLETNNCRYRPIVQDKCLGFDKRYLISGSAREKEDCTWQVYLADGLNPDRFLNVGDPKNWPDGNYYWIGQSDINYYSDGVNKILWPDVSWFELCTDNNGCTQTEPGVWPAGCPKDDSCITCEQISKLNCDAIRLARLMETPCLKLSLGNQGGTLRNGTYFALIAYSIKGQRVTDYFSQSNYQFVWSPLNNQGSLILDVSADSKNFDEFILVVVQAINQGTVAKQIGIYSTRTTSIALDQIKEDLVSVPLEQLPIQTPIIEKSNQITEVNGYLLRVGPTSKFDFNYQPLANLIKTKWASVEYPADYYVKGGNKTSYLRDENYTFYIRWVYNTGDKSASYHIPGRAPRTFNNQFETDTSFNNNALTTDDKVFEVFNTATLDSIPSTLNTLTNDGGTVIAVGNMGYAESTEKYPDDRPDIWNASYQCWTGVFNQPSNDYDLCGKNIRLHKFPENCLDTSNDKLVNHYKPSIGIQPSELKIRLMGVYFEDIIYPKDNDGNDIPGIIGYEILRGSREGNKSIIAKGMLNNFRTYQIQGQVQNPSAPNIGLYANYPFNTINGFYNTGTGNQHNRPFMDPYIRIPDTDDGTKYADKVLDQKVPLDIVSFHSPDTMFRTPFLSTTELKLYGYLRGVSNQRFIEPNKHPQFKLISDLILYPVFLAGMIEAIISMGGKFTINKQPSTVGWNPWVLAAGNGGTSPTTPTAQGVLSTAVSFYNTAIETYFSTGGFIADAFVGYTALNTIENTFQTALNVAAGAGVIQNSTQFYTREWGKNEYAGPLGILQSANQLLYYFSEGANAALEIIKALTPYEQYALQMIAHGFYSDFRTPDPSKLFRFDIEDSTYLRDNILQLPFYQTYNNSFKSYSINNLKRSDSVVLRTKAGPNYIGPYSDNVIGPNYILESSRYVDQSLTTLGYLEQKGIVNPITLTPLNGNSLTKPTFENPEQEWRSPIASHYAAIKVRLRNQYGQLNSVKQIVITPCEQKFDYNDLLSYGPYNACGSCNFLVSHKKINITPVFFGGDTYINRYTEKNSMFFFYDWLFGQPDGFEYNYQTRQMIPRPRFFVNSKSYDISELAPSNFSNPIPGNGALPTRFYRLDYDKYNYVTEPNQVNYPGLFRAKEANFYLACSSVRDFFVESEVLVDFREAGDYEWEKHYDSYRYTDLNRMFDINPESITKGNWFRYDYSLSVSKLYNQYFSSGNLQSRYYDPNVSKLCYTYYPDRIYYSLQQQQESYKDNWFVYLPNNYREFKSEISGVKSVNKSGIFITFKNDSPLMFQGTDTLNTELGTKITIGDGGLFSQPGQAVTNADREYEYGSSQNRLSVISTPAGMFYASQNQGKIFSYGGGLKEISQLGMKWWFALFLKCKLTEAFPKYPWVDNPVAGVGVQATYDNQDAIIYFCKKDYVLKVPRARVDYIPLVDSCEEIINGKRLKKGEGDYFTLDGQGRYLLGDPAIFENASWTASFDPKNDFWISFHDWHPDLILAGKTVFITTKENTFWKHNFGCDSYCNFYGVNYPFEIEYPIVTGQSPTVIKSFDYVLECYRRADNCVDQYHVLDHNFDTAIVYNTEQVSGYLNLNIFPKNNITLSLQYPKFNPGVPIIIRDTVVGLPGFDILFSKEENKYKFNQFWDITKDRGEFPIGAGYPPQGPLVPGTTELLGNYTQEPIWNTLPDGYKRELNLTNLDFAKPELQRKKFRHYLNFLTLRKEISGDVNMILKVTNSKNQMSPR